MLQSRNRRHPPDASPNLGDLFHDAPVGIFHSTLEGRLLRANPAMAAMLGYSSAEELLAAVTDLGTQVYADPDGRSKVIAEILASDGWVQAVIRARRKDGGLITVAMKGRKRLDTSGHRACLEGYLEDITALRSAQAALEKSAARWHALNLAGVVMVDNDLVTGMIHFSDGWKTLLGYAHDEIDNWQTIDAWHAMLHPDELPQILATLRADIEDGVTYSNIEHRVRCKDGRWKWVHVVGAVTERDANGKALRGSGVLTDVTYLKPPSPTDSPDPGEGEAPSSAASWAFDSRISQLTAPSGATLWLKQKEARFLRLLAESGPVPLRRRDAVIGLYARGDDHATHAFDMLLSRLRKKVETQTGGPFPLVTVHGVGYRFTATLYSK
jgi:PAS domain S-box-containing protein